MERRRQWPSSCSPIIRVEGFFDGIGIRLPTICIRPGKPNQAASSFFSGILREPLSGQEAVLPVSEDIRHWHASPRAAVGFLTHAATIDLRPLGARRTPNDARSLRNGKGTDRSIAKKLPGEKKRRL